MLLLPTIPVDNRDPYMLSGLALWSRLSPESSLLIMLNRNQTPVVGLLLALHVIILPHSIQSKTISS